MTDAKQNLLVATTAIVDRNATTAWGNFDGLSVTGSSKRNPEDEHLPEVGRDLAFADLFEKLSVKLRKRAQGRVNTFENDRKQRRASAERRETLRAIQEASDFGASYTVYLDPGEGVGVGTPRSAAYTEAFIAALDEMKKAFSSFPS